MFNVLTLESNSSILRNVFLKFDIFKNWKGINWKSIVLPKLKKQQHFETFALWNFSRQKLMPGSKNIPTSWIRRYLIFGYTLNESRMHFNYTHRCLLLNLDTQPRSHLVVEVWIQLGMWTVPHPLQVLCLVHCKNRPLDGANSLLV